MADDDDQVKKLSTKAAAGAALAGAAYAASGSAAVSMALGAVGTMLDDVTAWVMDRRRENVKKWWDALVTAPTAGPGIDAEQIRSRLSDPAVGETILQSVRRLDDFVHDGAIPPLGALAAEYLRDNRKPDRFFRSVSRALCDCEAEDLEVMRRVVAMAAQVATTHSVVTIYAVEREPQGASEVLGVRPDPPIPAAPPWEFLTPLCASVVHILAANGVGESQSVFGGNAVALGAERVARLAAILGPPSTPPPPAP